MAQVKLGRLPAVQDDRVPFLGDLAAAAALPAPPDVVDWYAGIADWGMLANDTVGDCVEACVGHATLEFTTYAGTPREPTDAEALALYTGITGYNPANAATDQGTLILGPSGAMQYWATRGVTFGGQRSFAKAFAQLKKRETMVWFQQAIHYFGGIVLGLDLPENVVAGDTIPFLWDDPSGPIAGGHCIWICGYETVAGQMRFDAVSWGQRVRLTEEFLVGTFQEAVTVYDPDSLNARGLNADDFDAAELVAAMKAIKAA
jgi:hypothetical protein